MRIGELSHRSGVSVRSLRYYEAQGLLPAERTTGGHREFLDCAPARVAWIRRLLAAGLNSATIAELMPHLNELTVSNDAGSSIPTHVGTRLRSELHRIDDAIQDLSRARALLRQLLESSTAPDLSGRSSRAR